MKSHRCYKKVILTEDVRDRNNKENLVNGISDIGFLEELADRVGYVVQG